MKQKWRDDGRSGAEDPHVPGALCLMESLSTITALLEVSAVMEEGTGVLRRLQCFS